MLRSRADALAFPMGTELSSSVRLGLLTPFMARYLNAQITSVITRFALLTLAAPVRGQFLRVPRSGSAIARRVAASRNADTSLWKRFLQLRVSPSLRSM
jgi:hypothetical protein